MKMVPIITMPAHPTNTWDRYGAKIEYIVIHYVGAVSTAVNNGNYYGNTPHIGASAHYFVDQTTIVYSVPLSKSAGHCGVDYSHGKAPFWGKCRCKNSIGIEMCCKKDRNGNWYIEPETISNTIDLVKELMVKYNIPYEHVIRHYDVCYKICPEPFVRDKSKWESFKLALLTVKEDDDMKRFTAVSEMPVHYQAEAQKLIDRGALRGRDNGSLDVSEDMIRTLIIVQRMHDADFEELKNDIAALKGKVG